MFDDRVVGLFGLGFFGTTAVSSAGSNGNGSVFYNSNEIGIMVVRWK